MKRSALYLRLTLLVAALVMTALSMIPAPADAWYSCEYYCGKAGPYVCYDSPAALNCTTRIAF